MGVKGKIIYVLDNYILRFLKDEMYLKIKYKILMKQKLNLDNPQTFNEKLQWLKLYDRKDIYTIMVDKYEAKKYVSDIIGEQYIIPTLGIYEKFDDINFEELPNKFIIKCTHDSGGLVICKDKSKFDLKKARKKISKCLKRNFYYNFREWPYKNVKPRIIVENYMEQPNSEELIDYKFFCFNGLPQFLYVSEGLSKHESAKISFVDMRYNTVDFYRSDYKQFENLPPKPHNFEKMKDMAKKLSENTKFLRVDFYEINSRVYFSELTFFPNAGFIPICPNQYDKILGDMIKLK